jgi:endo-1,4-beta-xylanase
MLLYVLHTAAFFLAGMASPTSLLGPGPRLQVLGEARLLSAEGNGAGVIRLQSPKAVDPYYLAEAKIGPNAVEIPANSVASLRFDLRAVKVGSPTGRVRVEGYIQRHGPPWQAERRFWASAGRNWTPYEVRFRADKVKPAGSVEAVMHLGQHAQTLEVRRVSWTLLGSNPTGGVESPYRHSYSGRYLRAPWRTEAQTRIDRHRKSQLQVIVTDRDGSPLSGVKVTAKLKRHAYGFGTFLDSPALRQDSDGERYRRELLARFNLVTVPMFDVDWGWSSPPNQAEWPRLAEWAKSQGLRRRGTNVLVPGWRWSPTSWRELESEPIRLDKAITASIVTRFSAFKDSGFESVDAFSEPRANPEFAQIFGLKRLTEWASLAKMILPAPQWTVNEDTILEQGGHADRNVEALLATVQKLREAGAPINAIALECRFGDEVTPPEDLLRILNRLDDAGLPILATELMVETSDEKLQADYLRDFHTLFFSHPATQAIVQWGFWEGQHWNPPAALFRKDWSPKPALKAIDQLVLDRWMTRAEGKTGRSGRWTVRGFHGDYELRIAHSGEVKTVAARLEPGSQQIRIALD